MKVVKNLLINKFNKFKYMIEELEKLGINIPIKHVSNSAAIMDLPDLNLQYGEMWNSSYMDIIHQMKYKRYTSIKACYDLKNKVVHIKEIEPNTGISYGLKYKSKSTEKIVTIPIGYADGFTRIQNNPKVSINNEIFDVVGRICMDQCMVRIDKDIDIKIGDEVIIFGESENECVENIANDLKTINYEVLCMVSRRVDRIYMERNAILQADSYLVKLK